MVTVLVIFTDVHEPAHVHVYGDGEGYGLHWESLDVDFTVPGLLAGMFGTQSWMARQGGQARSDAKAAAARANGRKGGRPKKQATAAG